MEAARWLADRGFGRAHVPVEGKRPERPEQRKHRSLTPLDQRKESVAYRHLRGEGPVESGDERVEDRRQSPM